MASLLADRGNHVILLDLLGHGESDQPTHAMHHRLEYGAEQVSALLDDLGFGAAVVGGMSLGANVSLQTAVTAPERVQGLVCEMPVLERGSVATMLTLFPLMLAMRYAGPAARAVFGAARRLPRTSNEPLNAILDTGGDPRAMAAVMHGYSAGPVCPPHSARRSITAPTLVIGHRWDWMHTLDDAEALVAELPDARLVRARSMIELRLRPDRLIEQVAGFLDDVWSA